MKTIKDAGSKYDVYSISPKIRQISLDWGYELTERDFFLLIFQTSMQKMSYYQFNRLEILQRATKKKKNILKKKLKSIMHRRKRQKLKSIRKKYISNWFSIKKKPLKK